MKQSNEMHCSYHQKYMLRSHRTLLQSLRLSEREILKSHIAAKLNGYVGGFGNLSDFEKVNLFALDCI